MLGRIFDECPSVWPQYCIAIDIARYRWISYNRLFCIFWSLAV